MLHLTNDDVLGLLTMEEAMAALAIGFDQAAARQAAHVPRLELWSPGPADDGYYCLGAMSGTTSHFGVSAIRIKSDVISWPAGRRQEKYAVEPGTYCGFVLLFSNATGAPLALLNDGIIQRMRVGASAGIAIDHLSPPDASTVGLLGSGGMAREHLEAISKVRSIDEVRVFSPTAGNREQFAEEMADRLGLAITPVDAPDRAVAGAQIVVTATNSMQPTIEADWLAAGATVVCVTRREVGEALVGGVDRTLQLGAHSILPGADVPDLEWPQSAAGGFVAGSEQERSRLPWRHRAEAGAYPSLIDVLRGTEPGRSDRNETILFINLGLQGVQFASVGARVLELAHAEGVGTPLAADTFLQDIRD